MRRFGLMMWVVGVLAGNAWAGDAYEVTTPGSPGTAGLVPALTGEGAASPGSANTLRLTDALPHSPALLVYSLSELAAPFAGGILGPAPDFIVSIGLSDANGTLDKRFRMPESAPVGLEIWMQAWVRDAGAVAGMSASNTLRAEVQSGQPPQLMFPGASYRAGFRNSSVAAGDFNGDGHIDLAASSRLIFDPTEEGGLNLLFGNEDGTLAAPVHYQTESESGHVAVGDLDGDGELDIVVANRGSDNLSMFFGDGDGSFTDATLLPVGELPFHVTMRDLNADGFTDLLVANLDSRDLWLFHGEGGGNFADPEVIPTLQPPRCVVVAHLNGDDVLDIAVAGQQQGPDGVTIHVGKAAGGFKIPVAIATGGSGASWIDVDDLNDDGLLDLVVANRLSDDVTILIKTLGGTYAPPVQLPVGEGPIFVEIEDLDDDGAVDLLVANAFSDEVTHFWGLGDGTFDLAATYPVCDGPWSLLVADLTGSGTRELVTSHSALQGASCGVTVLQVEPRVGFQAHERVVLTDDPYRVRVADVNHDGVVDVITQSLATDELLVLPGTGDGRLESPIATALQGAVGEFELGDLNGDGVLDAAVLDPGADSLRILFGDGSGTFTPAPSLALASLPLEFELGDLDRDGHLDVVVAWTYSNELGVFRGVGDGSFHSGAILALDGSPTLLMLKDMDVDGKLDVVVKQYHEPTETDQVSVRLGDGDGGLGAPVSYLVGGTLIDFTVGDLDLDRIPDLAFTSYHFGGKPHGLVSVLIGVGDGSFTAQALESSAFGFPSDVVIADFNLDSFPDLATGSTLVSILLGQGDGTFETEVPFGIAGLPWGLQADDLDGDGVPDLVAGNADLPLLTLLINQLDG
ncbi:MAG: hypothetical protein DHS20C15_29160 [Planctomycetota bacterium]|nr:MAG: hypothetical protein DHS20C15_29160 [Planctomycetota bacterium]